MAKYKGWKKRYSYLDDYRKGLDGKYVYYGRHYIYQGDLPIRSYKWMLGIIDILLPVLYVVGGLQDAGVIWNRWYVILPYAVEALVIFLLIWKCLTLIFEKVPVKAYMYKKSVPWFRPLGFILAVVCALSIIGTVICMLTNSQEVHVTGCIIYLVTKVLMGGIAVFFADRIRKYSWELDPSEEEQEWQE